jgi:hypothetical protein
LEGFGLFGGADGFGAGFSARAEASAKPTAIRVPAGRPACGAVSTTVSAVDDERNALAPRALTGPELPVETSA